MASPIGSRGSDPRLLGLTMGVRPDRTLGSDPVHQGLRTCPKVRPIKQLLPPVDSHKNEGESSGSGPRGIRSKEIASGHAVGL